MGDDLAEIVRVPQAWLAAVGGVVLLIGALSDGLVFAAGVAMLVAAGVWWLRSRNEAPPALFPASTTPISSADRAERLDTALAYEIARGWRIESRTTQNAVLVQGRRPNHVLHFLITVLTCGLWVFVWLLVAVGGERRRQLAVDPYGNIL